MCGKSLALMPGPWLVTVMATVVLRGLMVRLMGEASGLCLTALSKSTAITSRTAGRFMVTVKSSGARNATRSLPGLELIRLLVSSTRSNFSMLDESCRSLWDSSNSMVASSFKRLISSRLLASVCRSSDLGVLGLCSASSASAFMMASGVRS